MNKIAFLFPGQGSQYVGMGKELVSVFPDAKEIMDKANSILDFNVEKLCFEGPEVKLNNTEYTQPAIYTISYIVNMILNKKEIYPDMVAGHSLGEYSALASAGVYDFEDGLKLVRNRGQIMKNTVPDNMGSMAAIIGLSDEKLLLICQQVEGICEVANYNSPGQIVISGEKDTIDKACKMADENGAKKTVKLDVSGPFHSSLMKPAEEKFEVVLSNIEIKRPKFPVVANVTADIVESPSEIKELLLKQLSGSVRWVESIELMKSRGVETFIEVGPGRVLKGLLRRIDRSLNAYNVQDIKSLDKLLNKMVYG
ncbi:MAG: ACP S-malonyltransferase [Bacillota bacterium]